MSKSLRTCFFGLMFACVSVPSTASAQTCEDPARTVFAGGPGSEGCLQFADRTSCEEAWVDGHNGPASCYFDGAVGGCFGCGPNNENAGLCANSCTEPPEPPEDGTPIPCTIGFWKNRADTPMGQGHHFPDPEFDLVVDAAVSSSPVFVDADELLDALFKKGRRSQEERAEQQLSALILNLAAGDLFPDNEKCKLFLGNAISGNSCVDDGTVGETLAGILADISAGSFEDAKDCADDINNGIGVVDAEVSE